MCLSWRRQINKRHGGEQLSSSNGLPSASVAPLGAEPPRRGSAAGATSSRLPATCWAPPLIVLWLLVATAAFEATLLLEAKSIEESESSNGPTSKPRLSESLAQPTTTTTLRPSTSRPISLEALTDLIHRVSNDFTAANKATPASTTFGGTETSDGSSSSSPDPSSSSSPATTTTAVAAATTTTDTTKTTTTPEATTTRPETTAPETTTNKPQDYDDDEQPAGARDDDNDAQDCQGLSGGPAEAGAQPSDNERLVRLQTCLQKKVEKQLRGAARSSMEMFDRLTLSGACTASLFGLMSSLGQLKGFAFKFIDASAKVPSGMMSGLLSDFGDFEQCLAIRSNPQVDPRDEQELGGYSGKYCLLNIMLKYRVKLGPNATAPEGIYPDGVLWDELVRNYWTSNSTKGFQVGVCVPSRCNQDDLEQMLHLLAESYHFEGQIGACQDSNDLRRQQEPDKLQLVIMWIFVAFASLSALGTLFDLYWLEPLERRQSRFQSNTMACLGSFSIRRNWTIFLRGGRPIYDRNLPAGISRNSSNLVSDNLVGQNNLNHHLQSGNTSTLASNTLTGCSSSSSFYFTASPGASSRPMLQPLTIKILPDECGRLHSRPRRRNKGASNLLRHLWGLKLLVIIWITVGHSFLYPSANNYQHYRSIINMNITRTSVWFATTNFILGIDTLLYMTGLLFVHKLVDQHDDQDGERLTAAERSSGQATIKTRIGRLLLRKLLRFLPVYVAVIGLAIVTPLISNGPMWPEMVSQRLGASCRSYWWANLLMVNNLLGSSSRVCLPSSWFISVVAQCFLVGSLVMQVASRCSMRLAAGLALFLVCSSSAVVFELAYANKLNAPAIRMDESFVMELDDNIFQMYTSTWSNLGPFLIGMLGGFVLLWSNASQRSDDTNEANEHEQMDKKQGHSKSAARKRSKVECISDFVFELNFGLAMALLATVVLSSVFFTHYSRIWSAIYWSCHRSAWAIVTGYLVHQCATNKWRLLRRLLSLRTFAPLGRLIFLAYLVHPIFIHLHSGLVRDGLHVSLYNMLNIYISRLVMTFSLALMLHLLIELPLCSLLECVLNVWIDRRRLKRRRRRWLESGGQPQDSQKPVSRRSGEPLLAIAVGGDHLKLSSSGPLERQQTTETTLSQTDED